MRTLFLMAILAILLVIAKKEPNQTAWEAAHELKQDAQDAIAEVKKEPIVAKSANDVAEQYANFGEMLNKTLDGEERPASTTAGKSGDAEAGTPPEDRLPEPADAPEKAAPLPALPKLPDLSPALATGAPFGESETTKPNPAPPSRLTFRKDYGDVRSAYERASRFLAEIK